MPDSPAVNRMLIITNIMLSSRAEPAEMVTELMMIAAQFCLMCRNEEIPISESIEVFVDGFRKTLETIPPQIVEGAIAYFGVDE